MEISPETHIKLTDMKLSEVQHFLVSIHELAIGHAFSDPLHDLEWTALAAAGEAGQLAVRVRQLREEGVTVTNLTSDLSDVLDGLRNEAADKFAYNVITATLLGMSLTDFIDLACARAADWAVARGLDITDIATRGGVLFKYVIPTQVAAMSPENQERFMSAREDSHRIAASSPGRETND